MKRTQVFLPEWQVEKLNRISQQKGISKGEIIRRAIENYLEEERKMKKKYRNQMFTFNDGRSVWIDVVVENGEVTEIYAAEDFSGFRRGDQINIDGDDSVIRSQDIAIEYLEG